MEDMEYIQKNKVFRFSFIKIICKNMNFSYSGRWRGKESGKNHVAFFGVKKRVKIPILAGLSLCPGTKTGRKNSKLS